MASASSFLSEEQFQCSICLDVFTEPVSIQCGHTFCKTCITKYWDGSDLCQCPLCKMVFSERPVIRVNVVLLEMAAQFSKSVQIRTACPPDQEHTKEVDVPCDVCTGMKNKALKSCLVCLASYCETHLEPHKILASFKKHTLINPVENLEDRVCKKHERPLELFCRTDQTCVCQFCTEGDHRTHDTVPIEEECRERKTQMRKKEAEVQQMVQEREEKVREIKQSVELSRKDTKQNVADQNEFFTSLVAFIQKSQAEVIEEIVEKQEATARRAEGLIKELEQEITELQKKGTELEQLSHTEDHLHLLHSSPSLSTPPPNKDWSDIHVHSGLNMKTLRRTLTELKETLTQEIEKWCDGGVDELKRIQQYAVDVTLDPDTANPNLILSEDGKQVNVGGVKKNLTDNPKRFSSHIYVLGKQSFSSGRFYYEVEVKEKTRWSLGVARESINRKGSITLQPVNGCWIIQLLNGKYKARNDQPVVLSLKEKLQIVGVFVDYEEGLVSFYDVEAKDHIYSFTNCTFTEKLYPFFSPGPNYDGTNSSSLVICPVNNMASASSFLSEEQFQCSICLDVFTEPVSIQCGHTFCKTCITKYWDDSDLCQCPLCKMVFSERPVIYVNVVLLEMAAQFNKSDQIKTACPPDQEYTKEVDVPCDVCTGMKNKALKSCLVCLASYCETHLEPHERVASLKKHILINPVENLEDRVCKKHERPLELFCRTDQTCVCQFCTEGDHKTHETVPIEEEYREKKTQMRKKEAEVQQMIQEREEKVREIKQSVELSRKDTKQNIADQNEFFTSLVAFIQKSQAEVIEEIEDKQEATERRAEGLIKELEQEITELKKKGTELEQLSHTEDHLHLLHSSPSLSTPPPNKDWSDIHVHSGLSMKTLRRTLTELKETLTQEIEKWCDGVELKRIQQYAVDVTLDPDTANPKLILSEDGKQVHHGDVEKNLPDNPERFSSYIFVLGKQSFSSGRFYYEVEVKEKTEWFLGVIRESINRKDDITFEPVNGCWTVELEDGEYYANHDQPVLLSLKEKPQIVGVFVDYEEGLVSFYDVEAKAHIYSFTDCTFTEKLFPLFCPHFNYNGTNSSPLIICPVNNNE
ncbi:uncharacterized protein ACJ7VT_010709 [Polymixia lowei]